MRPNFRGTLNQSGPLVRLARRNYNSRRRIACDRNRRFKLFGPFFVLVPVAIQFQWLALPAIRGSSTATLPLFFRVGTDLGSFRRFCFGSLLQFGFDFRNRG